MGMDSFAPNGPNKLCFTVRNISSPPRKIHIFQAPIAHGLARDLLALPGVAESDIRASLLKGELYNKIVNKDITIICSNIDLLQFDQSNAEFLIAAGVTNGIFASDGYGFSGITEDQHKTLRDLIHYIDSGGGDGFTSGAIRIIDPPGDPFPTQIIWYLDDTFTSKLVEKFIIYNSNKIPTQITWNMYDEETGLSIIHTIIDTISYINNVFESSRVRTIL